MEDPKDLTFNCRLRALPFQSLNKEQSILVQRALDARSRSYSPYSKFQVGAALELESGDIVIGANQENAAYPSGLCAERVALFTAGVQFPNLKIQALAVSIMEGSPHIPFPCGSCLQVMSEYEHQQAQTFPIYLIHAAKEVVYVSESTRDLLPFSFNESHLPE